jgi:predicted transcriptional regulator
MKTEVIRAWVPEELKRDFEAAAAARGWDMNHAIRQLMEQYVAYQKETDLRRIETLEALEDIDAGYFVDGDRVLDWLSSWGANDESVPPQ